MSPEEADLAAARIEQRCREVAAYTETPGETTRPFLCRSAHAVQALVRQWMEAAGLEVRVDGMGNLRGLSTRSSSSAAPRLLLGSHLDTVPAAGAFDGILGVVLAIEAASVVRSHDLPFDVEVIGFSEEEGVRFRRPFLGSLAMIGQGAELLALRDSDGRTVEQALRHVGVDPATPSDIAPQALAYLEVHIEQGPVLDRLGQPLGVVEAIAGQSRCTLRFTGQSNHAGTTPMALRHDALAAAAEWIVLVESRARMQKDLVATVGRVEASPGASNIIAGEVAASLDVRHRDDRVRKGVLHELLDHARASATRRGVALTTHTELDQSAVAMDPALVNLLTRAAFDATAVLPQQMISGAGHDAMILARRLPSAMLFLRSPGGLSHHPDESVLQGDVAAALRTVVNCLGLYATKITAEDKVILHA